MKHLVLAVAVIALGACGRKEEAPAADSPAAAAAPAVDSAAAPAVTDSTKTDTTAKKDTTHQM